MADPRALAAALRSPFASARSAAWRRAYASSGREPMAA